MANHPNRNWRSKWTVDPSACTATHQSGIVVQYTFNNGGWDGKVISQLPDMPADIKESQKLANHLAKMMREAGDIYKEHLDGRS